MEGHEGRHGRATGGMRGTAGMPGPRGMHLRRAMSEGASPIARGGIRFAILDLLKEKPRHGYDMIREMEERSGGLYSPSPGAIYPTLQALEDQDLVTSATEEGKKVYSITEAGSAYLEDHKDKATSHRERREAHWGHGPLNASGDSLKQIRDSLHAIGLAVRDTAGDTARLEEVSVVLQEAAAKVREIAGR